MSRLAKGSVGTLLRDSAAQHLQQQQEGGASVGGQGAAQGTAQGTAQCAAQGDRSSSASAGSSAASVASSGAVLLPIMAPPFPQHAATDGQAAAARVPGPPQLVRFSLPAGAAERAETSAAQAAASGPQASSPPRWKAAVGGVVRRARRGSRLGTQSCNPLYDLRAGAEGGEGVRRRRQRQQHPGTALLRAVSARRCTGEWGGLPGWDVPAMGQHAAQFCPCV